MSRRFRMTIVATAMLAGVAVPMLPASAADAGSISGVAFQDDNRNGVQDVGESPRASDTLWLFDSTGTAIAAATTDATGRYDFGVYLGGSYSITYASTSWWNIRNDWVPTTSAADSRPTRAFTVPTAAPIDFGWRRIYRTVPPSAPVTRYVGNDGLVVESYNDVVDASTLYLAIAAGTMGAEAPYVRVLFDASGSSTTSTGATYSNGRWSDYSASVYVAWNSWLDERDRVLSHEYGHAWSLYYAYIAQQDPSLAGYLSARGLAGDPRLGSSYEWSPREMIAEDYRQLLGPATAASAPQANADIPPASAVPGLRDYLATTFTQPLSGSTGATTSSPSPTASASPSPTASPTPTASPSPATVASPSPTASPTPTASPAKTSKGGGCGKRC